MLYLESGRRFFCLSLLSIFVERAQKVGVLNGGSLCKIINLFLFWDGVAGFCLFIF